MCPDVADQADSGTKGSVGVQTWKSSNNRRACFRSTGFAEQSLFFCLAYPGLFRGSAPFLIRLHQVPRSAGRISPRPIVDFKGLYLYRYRDSRVLKSFSCAMTTSRFCDLHWFCIVYNWTLIDYVNRKRLLVLKIVVLCVSLCSVKTPGLDRILSVQWVYLIGSCAFFANKYNRVYITAYRLYNKAAVT